MVPVIKLTSFSAGEPLFGWLRLHLQPHLYYPLAWLILNIDGNIHVYKKESNETIVFILDSFQNEKNSKPGIQDNDVY